MSTLTKICFVIAAALCLAGLLAHEFLGAPMVFEPLDNSDIPDNIVWLLHFAWHVGSVSVATMSIMFVLASKSTEHLVLAKFATLLSGGFAVVAISLGLFGNSVIWQTPAPYPWTLVALFGLAGLWASKQPS